MGEAKDDLKLTHEDRTPHTSIIVVRDKPDYNYLKKILCDLFIHEGNIA